MTETPQPPNKPHWTLGAIVLVVVGLLIAVPSGLCVAGLGLPIAMSDPSAFIMVLLIGGVPFVWGVAFVIAGLVISRGKKPRS